MKMQTHNIQQWIDMHKSVQLHPNGFRVSQQLDEMGLYAVVLAFTDKLYKYGVEKFGHNDLIDGMKSVVVESVAPTVYQMSNENFDDNDPTSNMDLINVIVGVDWQDKMGNPLPPVTFLSQTVSTDTSVVHIYFIMFGDEMERFAIEHKPNTIL